ncbi:MAG TPA: hypothetical protein VIM73_12655 [Polyangiaceae bacterium]
MRASAIAGILLLTAACTPREPPSWPEGGAPLAIGAARWDRVGEDVIEIRPDGRVLEDGDLVFVVDRVGRVADADYEPFAILLPDGRVVGTDDRWFGHVGVTNAAPPWSGNAWLAVLPDGTVTFFDSDGAREAAGHWQGCAGVTHRTCTLVSHLIALRDYRPAPETGVGIGVGIGVGF